MVSADKYFFSAEINSYIRSVSMDKEKQKKSCANCAHYFQHYGWIAEHIQPLNCGHCLKHRVTQKEYGRCPSVYVCGSWEPEKIKLEKKNKKLKTILTEMAKKIDDIAAMLKNDNFY